MVLTLHCEEASHLMSDSHDRPLEFHERAALRGHKLSCGRCCKLERDLDLVVAASRKGHLRVPEDNAPDLSDTAKQRIKATIRQAVDDQ